ncbi:hypothetical protein QBC37DRAFT_380686 [Rhypophila decipiens]|uniref:Helitron helicase-like domain-containing protein n=1 Tax=Rhypophila decipiens TaxID=261697 RepID=A0AAN7B1W3_9PEZI|nr:hypothetical protein QBC37DRAFT_380686 [Rhypophila decipiens]
MRITEGLVGNSGRQRDPDAPQGWLPADNIEFVDEHHLGAMNVECSSCGALHWIDERLTDSSAGNPKFDSCCGKGSVTFPPFPDLPPFLRATLRSDDPRARDIQNNLRKYNNIFQFTSVRCETTVHGIQRAGPMDFQIQGTLYHYMGPTANADPNATAKYAQIYFHDPEAATTIRLGEFPGADRNFIT